MTARFYDPHRGIEGTGVPLPRSVASVAESWDGLTGSPADVVAEIAALFGQDVAATVRDVPPGPDIFRPGRIIEYGMITLDIDIEGCRGHCWRVLIYEPIPEGGAR